MRTQLSRGSTATLFSPSGAEVIDHNVNQAVFLTGGQAFFGELQAQGVRRGQELLEPASWMPIPKSANYHP